MHQLLDISDGETVIFAVVATMMVALAVFGLLIARKAVYSVVSIIFVMVGLAVLYTALEAPFMGVGSGRGIHGRHPHDVPLRAHVDRCGLRRLHARNA